MAVKKIPIGIIVGDEKLPFVYDIKQSFRRSPHLWSVDVLSPDKDKIEEHHKAWRGSYTTIEQDFFIFILSEERPLVQADDDCLRAIIRCWPKTPIVTIWPFDFLPLEATEYFLSISPEGSVIFRRSFNDRNTLQEMWESINKILIQ